MTKSVSPTSRPAVAAWAPSTAPALAPPRATASSAAAAAYRPAVGRRARASTGPRAGLLLLLLAIAAGLSVAMGLAWPGEVMSQEISNIERDNVLRDAQSLARYGNYDSALERLQWLYARLPHDEAVVVSLFDFLIGREEYERARGVMETYIEFRPAYVGGMAKLADLYLRMGESEQARILLERFIETAQRRAWSYETAARTYIGAGLMDEALALIRKARELHKSECMLYGQAAEAYMRTERYAEAVNEYILAVEGGMLAAESANGGILAVAKEEGAVEVIVPVLEEAAELGLAGLVPLTALWHLSMADGDCVRGLKEVSRIVEREKGLVGLVVSAAREFGRKGCYGECAEAYDLAAKLTETREEIPELLLAEGRCRELSGDMEAAIETYAGLAEKYSGSRRAFDAHLALARVLRAVGRCDDAMLEADRAAGIKSAGKKTRKAVLLKGDCLLMLGRFDEAREVYDLVRPDWEDIQAQTAYFNLGEIAFYEHDFETALSYFNVAMREYPGEDLANDAVERLILIRGSRSGEAYVAELGVFADAALLERQEKPEEAVSLLRATAAADPLELRIQSLKNLVRIYLAMQDYENALETCKVAGAMAESHWSPVALETAGDIYLHLGMLDEAVAAYEDVIVRYPDSVSAGEARRKLYSVRRGT